MDRVPARSATVPRAWATSRPTTCHPCEPERWAGGGGAASVDGSHADSDARRAQGGGGGPVNQGGYGNHGGMHIPVRHECHVRHMPGFAADQLNGLALLGAGVRMRPMLLPGQHQHVGLGQLRAVGRGQRHRAGACHVLQHPRRVLQHGRQQVYRLADADGELDPRGRVAAILGPGVHAAEQGLPLGQPRGGGARGRRRGRRRRPAAWRREEAPKRVTWHMFQSEEDRFQNLPQVVVGYEDIYNSKRATPSWPSASGTLCSTRPTRPRTSRAC